MRRSSEHNLQRTVRYLRKTLNGCRKPTTPTLPCTLRNCKPTKSGSCFSSNCGSRQSLNIKRPKLRVRLTCMSHLAHPLSQATDTTTWWRTPTLPCWKDSSLGLRKRGVSLTSSARLKRKLNNTCNNPSWRKRSKVRVKSWPKSLGKSAEKKIAGKRRLKTSSQSSNQNEITWCSRATTRTHSSWSATKSCTQLRGP